MLFLLFTTLFTSHSKTAGSSRKKELPAVVFHSVRPRAANSLARPSSYTVGLSNLMEHELDNPQKMREYIQKIQTSSNHLLGLINDVLDMSKIESGENRMNIETFDLTEQIREIDMLIYAKYRFVITDNGIGMKKEYLEHIFEPFSRQENSVTNCVQGTGLRMAITKNIVDMMSGIIQVESEEGIGSTFEVIFEDCAPHSRYF